MWLSEIILFVAFSLASAQHITVTEAFTYSSSEHFAFTTQPAPTEAPEPVPTYSSFIPVPEVNSDDGNIVVTEPFTTTIMGWEVVFTTYGVLDSNGNIVSASVSPPQSELIDTSIAVPEPSPSAPEPASTINNDDRHITVTEPFTTTIMGWEVVFTTYCIIDSDGNTIYASTVPPGSEPTETCIPVPEINSDDGHITVTEPFTTTIMDWEVVFTTYCIVDSDGNTIYANSVPPGSESTETCLPVPRPSPSVPEPSPSVPEPSPSIPEPSPSIPEPSSLAPTVWLPTSSAIETTTTIAGSSVPKTVPSSPSSSVESTSSMETETDSQPPIRSSSLSTIPPHSSSEDESTSTIAPPVPSTATMRDETPSESRSTPSTDVSPSEPVTSSSHPPGISSHPSSSLSTTTKQSSSTPSTDVPPSEPVTSSSHPPGISSHPSSSLSTTTKQSSSTPSTDVSPSEPVTSSSHPPGISSHPSSSLSITTKQSSSTPSTDVPPSEPVTSSSHPPGISSHPSSSLSTTTKQSSSTPSTDVSPSEPVTSSSHPPGISSHPSSSLSITTKQSSSTPSTDVSPSEPVTSSSHLPDVPSHLLSSLSKTTTETFDDTSSSTSVKPSLSDSASSQSSKDSGDVATSEKVTETSATVRIVPCTDCDSESVHETTHTPVEETPPIIFTKSTTIVTEAVTSTVSAVETLSSNHKPGVSSTQPPKQESLHPVIPGNTNLGRLLVAPGFLQAMVLLFTLA